MRTLLRKIADTRYFQAPGRWTPNTTEARDFHSMNEAIEFVESAGYRNMEVAFLFENPPHESAVRVDTLEGFEA